MTVVTMAWDFSSYTSYAPAIGQVQACAWDFSHSVPPQQIVFPATTVAWEAILPQSPAKRHVWNGSVWVRVPEYVWNGSAWQQIV